MLVKKLRMVALLISFYVLGSEASLRVATFNVSMEATNYIEKGETPSSTALVVRLGSGENQQIKNIAEIIQRIDPDVILLNEFDLLNENDGILAFKKNYLEVSQQGQNPIQFPYHYVGPVNTGMPSPFDLNNDNKREGYGNDAYGYGLYEGQYAMVLLSKYPIEMQKIRTFQHFKWRDMPNALRPEIKSDSIDSKYWYHDAEWADFRLSSKSHWDIPVNVNGTEIHLLAMHPTPPNFDGAEDRNGKRNHDEIRLMADYLSTQSSQYIYDDEGQRGGLSKKSRFVLVGDFNATDIGDKHRLGVIEQLTEHTLVNNRVIPVSDGAKEANSAPYANRYTAYWGARADYVLPSTFGFQVTDAGVFWPVKSDTLYRLVKDRKASSDHRLVWVDLSITE
jgi:endonuclease/exonuclease/phosphatase family metal-dependent hydrolase